MTQNERNKLYVARCLLDGKMTIREAAEGLGLSERQVKRLKKGVKEHGEVFVIHKNRGRKPQHALTDAVKRLVIEFKSSAKYSKANFSHFQELLLKHESVNLSKASVYRILTGGGCVSPKKHRKIKLYHRRKRKPQKGMLVIIDASPHAWLCNNQVFSLHGAVDDATGQILSLYFTPNECLEGYFQIMRDLILQNGIPLSVYADRHTIFCSPKTGKLSLEDQLEGKRVNDTQFGRAMRELGINLIYAKTPQAKGRIERLWETLQSRLPVELEIANIKTLDEANAFLATFIKNYNDRFAVEPKDSLCVFQRVDAHVNIDHILCWKETRQVDHGSTFSYQNSFYTVIRNGSTLPIIPKAKITVLKSPRLGLKVLYSGLVYDVEALDEAPSKQPQKTNTPKKTSKPAPSLNHPWKSSFMKPSGSFYDYSDREIIEALYNSRLAWK